MWSKVGQSKGLPGSCVSFMADLGALKIHRVFCFALASAMAFGLGSRENLRLIFRSSETVATTSIFTPCAKWPLDPERS